MSALLGNPAPPKLLKFQHTRLQLPLLLAIGHEVKLSLLLRLVEMQQGLLTAFPGLPQVRFPTGQAFLQLRKRRLHTLGGKEGG